MDERLNIFIEGIPGSGKTTLLNSLAAEIPGTEKLRGYAAYREGELSPIELAWCSLTTEAQYDGAKKAFPELAGEIDGSTVMWDGRYVTAYTKLRWTPEFYGYMEKYEIYGGRRSAAEFTDIVTSRFGSFRGSGNIFECSFFQNIIDELLLFAEYDDGRIEAFYRRLIPLLDLKRFRLLRLLPEDIGAGIGKIRRERVDSEGRERWYEDMTRYLRSSPYGKRAGISLESYFRERIAAEDRVLSLLPGCCCRNIRGFDYKLTEIIENL